MAYIKSDYHAEIDGLLLSSRYGGTLFASKNLKHLNKNDVVSSFNEDELKVILDDRLPAEINKLLKAGYRVLHCTEVGAHYYSADGK